MSAPTPTAACAEHEVAISLLAAGALEADEAARLEAHVQGCAPCRAVLDGSRRALGLAALPPVSDDERRAMATLPARLRAELTRRERHRTRLLRGAILAGVAAALLAAVASPVLLQKSAARRAQERAAIEARLAELQELEAARAHWEPPDPDALYEASGAVLDYRQGVRGSATYTEAALSSYDAGMGR
ncbi:MAG: zf-HC2 domain-containing protein [Anaeromyxobacteraceae bacterium]